MQSWLGGVGESVMWPVGPEVQQRPVAGGGMLYDASRAGNAVPAWFHPDWWRARGEVTATAAGRGSSWFIDADGRSLVLRHYRRGGLMARVTRDQYWWQGEQQTRSFAEWHLLYQLLRAGLPVPQPIAALYLRNGRTYSAALITERIADTQSLAALLGAAPQPLSLWIGIGRTLARFHVAGVNHADLNAHNLLLDAAGELSVIDFDRGKLSKPGLWCDASLVRLHRSLLKIAAALPADRFDERDWMSLLDGYFAAGGATGVAPGTAAAQGA
jgi:3-deoxy-D-manno-octulosonic acid kinase